MPLGLKALLVLALSAIAPAAADNAPIRTTPFPDVPKTHWAYDAVESLRQKGILRGYPPAAAKAVPKTKRTHEPAPQNAAKRKTS
jgi:hypothetical protein